MTLGSFGLICMVIMTVHGLNVEDFFPDINQNLTKITWEHAVNNASFLASALDDSMRQF